MIFLLFFLFPSTQALQFTSFQFKADTYSKSENPVFGQEFYFQKPLIWKLNTELAGRIRENSMGFFSVDYKFELFVPWFSFFSTRVWMVHQNLIQDNFSTNAIFGVAELKIPIYYSGILISLGWYERFNGFNSVTVLPVFTTLGMVDRDLGLRLGFWIDFSTHFRFAGMLSSYDRFDTYYFHNSFFEASVQYQKNDWNYGIFARYKILFGFGQNDGWMGGFEISPPKF